MKLNGIKEFHNSMKINGVKKSKFIFTYNNVIYTYQVVDIFEEEKDGDIEISKTNSEQLVLTTCSPHNDDKQLIVDTILINEKRVN